MTADGGFEPAGSCPRQSDADMDVMFVNLIGTPSELEQSTIATHARCFSRELARRLEGRNRRSVRVQEIHDPPIDLRRMRDRSHMTHSVQLLVMSMRKCLPC